MNYVYWIYNEECKDISEGYIGITYDVERRFKTHLRNNDRIPKNAQVKILFEGSREECFNQEELLRPNKNMGWNSAAGGKHGWRIGFRHSEATRDRLKSKWSLERKIQHVDRLKIQSSKLRGQKRPKQSASISGVNNGMYGRSHSAESREAMSKKRRGRPATNLQHMYCIGCHKKVNTTVLHKYHNKCFKLYCEKVK